MTSEEHQAVMQLDDIDRNNDAATRRREADEVIRTLFIGSGQQSLLDAYDRAVYRIDKPYGT